MTPLKLLIQGGHLVDPSQGIDGPTDLLIEEGKVAALGKNLKAGGARVIDARGKVVAPGFIDLHVHLRVPGQEHKEDLTTGSQAAIQGGFTTVCSMANTDPVVDTDAVVEFLKAANAKVGLVNLLPFAAVTMGLQGETLTEMGKLKEHGAAGFSDDGAPIMNAGVMRRALEYTKLTHLPVAAHCEDIHLSANGVAHEGQAAARLGLAGIPSESETVMIARDLLLAEAVGGRLHIAHVSTERGVELIRAAKARGVLVTAEATPHHLTLTDEAMATYDTRFKMNPPLRAERDVRALREGLKDGTIDAVATDHAPHSRAEKEAELSQAPFGVVGLETALGVLMTELVRQKHLKLSALIAALTLGPARVLGIDRGRLAVGSAADVTLLDPLKEWTVDPGAFRSKGAHSPFAGWRLTGKVTDVVVSGRAVYRDEQFVNGEKR